MVTMTREQRVAGVRAWVQMWRATKTLEAEARRSVASSGLCMSDFGVLESLLHGGPLPVSELGRRVLLTSGSITSAVDRLERDGLVERTTTAADRRSRIVRLTGTGADLARQQFDAHERDMDDAFRALSDDEIAALDSILRKLLRATRRAGAPTGAATADR